MTIQELAEKLNGSQYREEGSKELFAKAKENNLVAVFGASDDLMEFRGAIYDELGAWEGRTAYVNKDGLMVTDSCNDKRTLSDYEAVNATQVHALWCPTDENKEIYASWLIDVAENIPHKHFDVFEDGELYCRGVVFSLDDVN